LGIWGRLIAFFVKAAPALILVIGARDSNCGAAVSFAYSAAAGNSSALLRISGS